ncbi:MAG TPA: F0F1 ATP synthase subunit epsilon [Candidatus Saccharimonadales bacterium]|nr:F0F1 ATP synthase subunit epsilon [Candidatus Saccharimonadales bacterium]
MVKRQDASTGEIVDDSAASQTAVAGKPFMTVKVYSPFKTYFDAIAESVSGENKTGPFDILPHHHNFITLLEPGELVIRGKDVGTVGQNEQRIRISGGLMHVKADKVVVFLDV